MENGRIVLDGPAERLKENEDRKEFCLGLGKLGGRKSHEEVEHHEGRKGWLSYLPSHRACLLALSCTSGTMPQGQGEPIRPWLAGAKEVKPRNRSQDIDPKTRRPQWNRGFGTRRMTHRSHRASTTSG